MFEISDPITISNIRKSIFETIANYEPRVIVNKIYIEDLTEINAYHISLEYTIRGINTIGSFETILKRLR